MSLTTLIVAAVLLTCIAGLLRVIWLLQARNETNYQQFKAYQDCHQASIKEMCFALNSVRNIFDHISAYVEMDPRLDHLLFEVSQALAGYPNTLPALLRHRNGMRPPLREKLSDNGTIAKLVAEINDPVFNLLWEARSPSALSEMLRHGLFLALGYPYSVSQWSPEGVNLKVTLRDPGYTNWGNCGLQHLKGKHMQVWRPG